MSTKKSRWRWITFGNAKGHLVHDRLRAQLLADLTTRGCQVHNCRRIFSGGMDRPGCVFVDRPWEHFLLGRLDLHFPSEDLAAFLLQLQGLQPRLFGSLPNGCVPRTYYKLHGFMVCLVLTPWQYTTLTQYLTERLELAEQRARAFYADKMPIGNALREASAIASLRVGEPLAEAIDRQPPSQPHPTDRFLPRERGQA